MRVQLADGNYVECDDQPKHEGAEGKIYFSRNRKYVVKLYQKDDPNRKASLEKIIGTYNAVNVNPEYWGRYFSWPTNIVIAPQLGVVMPLVPSNLRPLDWFLLGKPRSTLEPETRGSWDKHVLVAIRLSRSIRRLHQMGLSHSDLSRNNCLADMSTGEFRLIDTDGLVVPGILPPQVFGTPEFMAPEILSAGAKPSTYTDLHALAVLVYQTLLFRHPLKGPKVLSNNPEEDDRLGFGERALYIEHPTDRSNWPKKPTVNSEILGASIAGLMKRAFVDGLHNPSTRPQAAYWEQKLFHLHDRLLECTNPRCEGRYFPFVGHKPLFCPWCKTTWQTKTGLPVLDFYHPVSGRSGQYQPDDHQKAITNGSVLYEWHVLAGTSPGPQSNTDPKVTFAWDSKGGEWKLANLSDEPMKVIEDQPSNFSKLYTGDSVALRTGMRILLGSQPEARLAYVRIMPL